jgi:hypothetical protein
MTANPKQVLHEFIDGLSDQAVDNLSSILLTGGDQAATRARPLREDDIILARPLLPNDESADEMIGAIRRWRRDGGYA